MATFGLLEMSPLSGDLMEYASPVEVSVYAQDGATVKGSGLSQLIQGHEESSSLQHGLLDPLEFGWMDSNVDLLQFLTGEEVAPLEPVSPPADKQGIREADSAIAVEILKSVAEDTTKLLDSGSDPGEMSPSASQDVDWFDMLDAEVSEVLGEAQLPLEATPILSPVTAEDVESILSSGTTSPVMSPSQEVWASEPLTSPIMSPSQEPPMSPVFTQEIWVSEAPTSPDVDIHQSVLEEAQEIPSDLECLLAQVERRQLDDHSYPSVVVTTSPPAPKSSGRSKPYSRKGARPTTTTPTDKVLDRKERKKQQNKDAALRYRLKKKQEAGMINGEVDVLENRNKELKQSVEQMTREIKYLKNLLADVYRAKESMKS